jgi:hypothetical protein
MPRFAIGAFAYGLNGQFFHIHTYNWTADGTVAYSVMVYDGNGGHLVMIDESDLSATPAEATLKTLAKLSE